MIESPFARSDEFADPAFPAGSSRVFIQMPKQDVTSYGIHRYSNTTRLTIAFVAASAITALVLMGILFAIWFQQGVSFLQEEVIALIAGGVLSIVIATLLGRVSARGITVPLEHMTATLKNFTLGKSSARTGFTGFDEVGRLGRTFDEMADALEKARSFERQITVDIAHELRTPLMAIQATLEAMIDQVMPADEDHLITLHEEAVRLSRLVDAQLMLSRLENRRVTVNARRIDLGESISQLMLSYTAFIEDAGLTLEMQLDSGVYIFGDPDLLRQALANLISNAVRYTAPGGAISVRVGAVGSMAHISVADTGIGIAQEEQDKIFEKLYRADDGRSRDHGGLGIGLAVGKEIVEIHGGTIDLKSAPGEGSIFTMEIPLLGE
jgi:signal transduction histidine kinase